MVEKIAAVAFGAWLLGLASGGMVRAQEFERGPEASPHLSIDIACTSCHTSTSWSPLRGALEFDHNRQTRFALRGFHERVQCKSCHPTLEFSKAGTGCADCHADIHRRQFGARCGDCHTVRGWRVSVQAVQAHRNRFPLLGAHAAVECESCHKGAASARFTGLSTDCASCHLRDYQQARTFDHKASSVSVDCSQCHGMDNWRAVRFDHAQVTRFSLTGAHARVDCQSCHTAGTFARLQTDCYDCHSAQFASAKAIDHVRAGLPRECAGCHTTASWQGAVFDHNARTRFPLAGAHVRSSCAQCHTGGRFAGTRTDCYGCHIARFEAADNPNHARSNFPTDCQACHTVETWQGARFDHALARFQLTGAHVNTSCSQCHQGGRYTGTSNQCASCHMEDFQKTSNPNHVAAGFPQDCTACHTTTRWQGAAFDHSTRSRFALTGAHVQTTCARCHSNGAYAGTSSQCQGCHLPDFQKAANPNHVAAGFPQDCSACHTTTRWQGGAFNHTTSTKFQLTGAHSQAACSACHSGGKYAGTPTQCSNCHLGDYQKTANPNHATAGFPQDCSVCHTTTRWQGGAFNHTTSTKFQLTGAHSQAACSACHTGGKYAGTPTQCSNCHLGDYQKTANPNHAAAGFPQDCTTCHTTTRWAGATFNHSSGRFPLTGAHTQAACSQCHRSGQYSGISAQCASCHLGDYQKTTNPNHAAAGFPQDCAACHTTTRWPGATFDHSASTRFRLTGAHIQASCAGCHTGGRYAGTPTQCAGCHLANYQRTTNPNHVASSFPEDCSVCHTTTRWSGASYNHSTGRFPLTGAHVQATCTQCHVGGRYTGTSTQCASCHLPSYQGTTNPSHAAAGFPQDCSVCHTTTRWSGATFNHSSSSFPLTGRHTSAQCSSCHGSGVYNGLSTACSSCHLASYQRTTNPNHVSAGFPQQCSTCHTTSGWTPATFNHGSTRFPLTGRHTSVLCANCHIGGRYAGTPTDCYACHTAAYNSTTNPGHAAAGFPTSCQTCHTTSGWSGATFNHTWFPIPHRAAKACGDCHTNPANYTVFTCTSCHAKNQMDSKHSGRSGYVYNSANCYQCHPNGRG